MNDVKEVTQPLDPNKVVDRPANWTDEPDVPVQLEEQYVQTEANIGAEKQNEVTKEPRPM